MAGSAFPQTPQDVPGVNTPWRRIATPLPAPGSLPVLESLRRDEPKSMGGQPPIVWDRADGVQIHDAWGNAWLDFSSGVLVTNAGHADRRIKQAVIDQAEHGLLHNYCFPSSVRSKLAAELVRVAPAELDKVFLLTTGSEATECAIKLARTHGLRVGGPNKIGIVTFQHAFHGRTLGAQMAGGIPALKDWIVNLDPDMAQAPFPDGFRCPDTSFDLFLRTLDEQGYTPDRIAGVMTETYQGGNSSFAPPAYVQKLRAWCEEHDVVLIMDEVQAGFGRTGTYWGFEHYGVTPDLICCGKGISGGLPLSAVIGKAALMDQYPPGSMTSTHTGNPICAAAALANLRAIEEDAMVENAHRMGDVMQAALRTLGERFPDHVGAVHGKGLVASLHMVKPGTNAEPDAARAADIVWRCVTKGLMLFAPVGFAGASVKLCPPLCITEDALREGLSVIEQAVAESIEHADTTQPAPTH